MAGNANSGRRPKPTALKLLQGNPGKGRLNAQEPVQAPVGPDFDVPPPELEGDAVAAQEWARVAPLLRACRMVSEAERGVLVALCQQWSRYREAQAKVIQLGMVVKTPAGIPITNPYLAVSDKALAACLKIWVELGLTPSARSKIAALPQAEPSAKSKWAGLL